MMKILQFALRKQDIKRIRQILNVLVRHGLGYVVQRLDLKNKLPFPKQFVDYTLESSDIPLPERIRIALEELGPTFVKFGQIMSTREDLIGHELAEELAKLQDETTPFPFEEVRRTLAAELKKDPDTIFSSIEPEPLASGSIAQVHRAKLLSGEEVVIKVQRPHIDTLIEDDIRVMRYFALLIHSRMPDWNVYNIDGIIDEFQRMIFRELDFRQEARNMIKFKEAFRNYPGVYVPHIYRQYTTKKVLVMEYVEGTKLKDVFDAREGYDKPTLARTFAKFFFAQVVDHGFFHADPHPGNVLVKKDGSLCLLDYGMVGSLDREFSRQLVRLFLQILDYDISGIIEELSIMGLIGEDIDLKSFRYDLIDIMDLYAGAQLKEVEIGTLVRKLVILMRKYHVELPREFVLLSRAIVLVEGIEKKLDPTFNTFEVFLPFAQNALAKEATPASFLSSLKDHFLETEHFLSTFPRSMRRVIQKIEQGRLNVEFEHKNLNVFSDALERTSNKLSMALIISALIVGSSYIMQTDKGPLLFEFPILGIAGFVVSAFLGLLLVISILRYHRL